MLKFFEVILESLRVRRPLPPYDDEWAREHEWYRQFDAKGKLDYSEVLELAKERYKELLGIHDSIDKKAEWMFGIALGGIAAMLAAVIPWKIPLYSIFPTLIAFLVAVLATMRCRVPNKRPSPMTIHGMVEVLENEPKNFKGVLAASIHCAVEGLKRVNEWKTMQVCAAVNSLILGAILLIVPMAFRDSQCPPAEASSRSAPCQSREDAHKGAEPSVWNWDWDWTFAPTAPDHPIQTD